MLRKKVLITGVDGFLGKKLFKVLGKKFNVVGTSRRRENRDIRKVDIIDFGGMEKVLMEEKPDVIVHAAALVDIDRCEAVKAMANKVNTLATENIARSCGKMRSKLIFVSSDYVFSGREKESMPNSVTNPINHYGKTKADAEKRVADYSGDFLIVRPSIFYGFNDYDDKRNFVLKLVNNLGNGDVLELDNQRIKYPLLLDDFANAIEDAIGGEARGIMHVNGKEGLTKYDWGKRIAKVFEFSDERIAGKDMNETNRPFHVKLAIGYTKVRGLDQGLNIVKGQILNYKRA